MDSFFSRFKNSLVLVALLVVQTVGLAVQVRRPAIPAGSSVVPAAVSSSTAPDGPHVTLARSWIVAALSPAERAVHTTSTFVRSTWGNYLDLRRTRDQNLDLRHQLDTLRLQQAAIAEDALQGQRLQTILAFQQHYVTSTVAAEVIGTSGTDLSRILYLNKGAADGLKADMAVITPDGIVGKIREVFPATAPHVSQLLLINDQTSGAGVLLAVTRVRAVIRGTTAGYLQIGNLTEDNRIKPGEQVLTSGGDGIFPRGLPVGTIESIAPDLEHQPYTAIRIRPSANLTRLEEVLVITGTENSLPPATLHALAKGAAATADARAAAAKAAAERAAAADAAKEEAARSAAEVVADRLPGLHDPNESPADRDARLKAAALAAASPRTAGGTIPRPLPTVHTDRYSPGTTPPASSLTPGAPHTTDASPPISDEPPQPRRSPKPAQPDTEAPSAEAPPQI
jgi:rod shape-determining protein MreC